MTLTDDDDGSLPEDRLIGFYATWGWDEWGGFPLPSSQTIMGEQLVQGCYAVAWSRFEPATFRLQGAEHTPMRPHPININYINSSSSSSAGLKMAAVLKIKWQDQ